MQENGRSYEGEFFSSDTNIKDKIATLFLVVLIIVIVFPDPNNSLSRVPSKGVQRCYG